jgi:YspA, cpYpsA-related SLOG family
MRVLVTGSRDWWDWEAVFGTLADLAREHHGQVVVVHGAAHSGADHFADMAARSLGLTPEPHPADWATHNRRAGPIRNAEMVALGADLCLAFIRNGSRGATHCAGLAEKAGIPVKRYTATCENRQTED